MDIRFHFSWVWLVFLKAVKVLKNEESLRNWHSLEEPEETGWLNVIRYREWDRSLHRLLYCWMACYGCSILPMGLCKDALFSILLWLFFLNLQMKLSKWCWWLWICACVFVKVLASLSQWEFHTVGGSGESGSGFPPFPHEEAKVHQGKRLCKRMLINGECRTLQLGGNDKLYF